MTKCNCIECNPYGDEPPAVCKAAQAFDAICFEKKMVELECKAVDVVADLFANDMKLGIKFLGDSLIAALITFNDRENSGLPFKGAMLEGDRFTITIKKRGIL